MLGVIVLRVRDPKLERSHFTLSHTDNRPYKVFITTPIIFCCAALFLLSRGVFQAPLQALFAAAFIVVGVPLYYIFVTGWRYFPGLRTSSVNFVVTVEFLGIKPPEGRRLRGFGSITSLPGRERGYSLASQGQGSFRHEDFEMMERA